MQLINVVLLFCAVLLFASVLASSLSARIGMPLLLGFLLIGMLAGEDGILGLQFSSFGFANMVGQAALAVILLDGGLRTAISTFRVALKPASVMATWGVMATVGTLGCFVMWLLGVDWRLGMLMAAIVGSTDAAAVFSLLRHSGIRLNERVQATLEIESGVNDPMAILLVTAFIALNLEPQAQSLSSFAGLLLRQLGLGLAFGFVGGWVLSKLLGRVRLADAMYALLILSGGFAVFALTNLLGGSGFLAVYLAGVLVGNYQSRATGHVFNVMDGLAWLSQATLFVMLGLLVTPSDVLGIWHYGLAVAAFLVLVARPLAVVSGLLPFGFRLNEILFISWVGLRGAVPITLAIIPVMMGVSQSVLLFDLAFAVVVLSLLVQGSTLPLVARWCGVILPETPSAKSQHRLWLNEQASVEIFEFVVAQNAFVIGLHPEAIAQKINAHEVKVLAFVHADEVVTMSPETRLAVGDGVWFAVRGEHVERLARLFGDSVIKAKSESEFYGQWVVSPHVRIKHLSMLDSAGLDSEVREMTVLAFIRAQEERNWVVGDKVAFDERAVFTVKQMDDKGNIMSLGLKIKPLEEKQ